MNLTLFIDNAFASDCIPSKVIKLSPKFRVVSVYVEEELKK
jgi:hypothetical protein